MPKIVFFNISAHGHVNPSLPVVAALVARGADVVCVNAGETRAKIEPTGARFVAYPQVERAGLLDGSAIGTIPQNALSFVRISEQLMPFVFDLLEREQPDIILLDSLCGWARQAAARLNLPTVSLTTTLVVTPDAMRALPLSNLIDTFSRFVPVIPGYVAKARRMKRNFGVKGLGLIGALSVTGDLNLVFTSKEFQPSSDRLGPSFRFVGPALSPRPDDSGFPFDQLTRKPVIYISLGTINNTNADFYRACFAAFSNFPAQIILSVGRRTDIGALGSIPTNFIVRNHVPQLEVLQRSDLFITHGGMNSVHEGLWYNVPLVVVPQQVEQALVARLIVKHGAGVAVGDRPPYGRVTADELRGAVERALADRDRLAQGAQTLGETFRAAGGAERAADEILAFIGERQPSQ